VKPRNVPADEICDNPRNDILDVVFDVPAHGPGNVPDDGPDNKLDDWVSFELAAKPVLSLVFRLAMRPDFGVGERLGVRLCLRLCPSLVLRLYVGLRLSLSMRLGVVSGLKLKELAGNRPEARPVEGLVDKPSPGPPPGWNFACGCPFWPVR
jgi:hypothetical protein